MSKKTEGWGCLLSVIVISILFVAILPKGNKTDTSANKKNYWYKKRMDYEKTKKEQQREEQRQIDLHNYERQYQNEPVSKVRSSGANTPDDAYSEGYDYGYEQGKEDGSNGYGHGHGYDDSSSYYDYYETRYKEGYEEGYNEGYNEGSSAYEDNESEDD